MYQLGENFKQWNNVRIKIKALKYTLLEKNIFKKLAQVENFKFWLILN